MSSTTLKMIKKDASIPVTIGAGFFQKLQSVLLYLTEERTDEELNHFKTLSEKGEEFPEPWMDHLFTMIILTRELENAAESNNMTVNSSIDDAINQLEN